MNQQQLLSLIEQAKYENKTELYLGSKRVTKLPPEIGRLGSLSTLYLSDNPLTALPPEIGQLTNLKTLHLASTRVSALPPEIGRLTNLKNLYFYDTRVSALSPEIGRLTNLTQLHFADTLVSALPPEIGQLTNLTHLYFHNTLVSALPPEIGRLTNLWVLDFSGTPVSVLPPEIGQLTNLTHLNFSGTQVTALPPEIRRLANLRQLSLTNNPGLNIPPEIAIDYKNPRRILDYYFENVAIAEEDQRPLNEVKLLLLGQGGVGKTSLVECMVENNCGTEPTVTEGIDIHKWARGDVRLNVWDFGGQEIMHATHQFFLTARSLYLVVVDAQKGDDESRIHYWLQLVQSFGKGSPVIIVSNKSDKARLAFNERGLRERYPNIRAFVHVSAKTGDGIPGLLAAIDAEIGTMDHLRQPLSIRWLRVKERLEDMRRDGVPYIKYAEYEQYCAGEGISDEGHRDTLISYLHALGTALNFRDKAPTLLSKFVLNPAWVTRGIYAIINDKDLSEEHGGVLESNHLLNILKDEQYGADERGFILKIMEKFELCFTGDEQTYLVPGLLPVEQPEFEWTESASLLFQYDYEVLPESVFSRFVVNALRSYGSDVYWRQGIILRNVAEDGNLRNEALATVHPGDAGVSGEIRLSVTGDHQTRAEFLARLRGLFDLIHASIPGLRFVQVVPIPDHPGASVKYDTLLANERAGVTRIVPDGMSTAIDVAELLGRVGHTEHQQVTQQYIAHGDLHVHTGDTISGDKLGGDKYTLGDVEGENTIRFDRGDED